MEASNLHIISFNCRSLYARLSEIKLFIYNRKPHVVCFTETWLFNDVCPKFVNYKSFWRNRQHGRGGGLGTLVRNDITVLPCGEIIDADNMLEVQRIAIKLSSGSLDVMNVYNASPQSDTNCFQHYFNQLSNNFVIIGDFNHSRL